jgi:hypothetical protein
MSRTTDKDRYPCAWTFGGYHIDVDVIRRDCQPGDCFAPSHSWGGGGLWAGDDTWRVLRRQLATRNLAVACVGQRPFILPMSTLPRLPLLRTLATQAVEDATARAALKDCLQEQFDSLTRPAITALARLIVNACRKSPGKHRDTPGGDLHAPSPAQQRKAAEAEAKRADLARRSLKLSKLQRELLRFARDHAE